MDIKENLRNYFGYNSFKKGQEEIINAILNKNDVLGVLPTGGGKSICYQLPAVMFNNLTIVISPLISLMKNQVDTLNENGINSGFINSSMSNIEIRRVIDEIMDNKIKLLYVSPERLDSYDFINLIKNTKIDLIAIDEAHCVSQWGYDFRPSYRNIISFIEKLNTKPVIVAFTATATKLVRDDIID